MTQGKGGAFPCAATAIVAKTAPFLCGAAASQAAGGRGPRTSGALALTCSLFADLYTAFRHCLPLPLR